MQQLLFILLQSTEEATAEAAGNANITILFMVGFLIIMYLFFIRPNVKRQKEEKQFLESLQKGDKVRTIGGIHGKILNIDEQENTITLDAGNNVKLKFDKASVKPIMTTEEKK